MDNFTQNLLNLTWAVALISISFSTIYFSFMSVKYMQDKKILDEEIFGIIKDFGSKIFKLQSDLDALGKKVRDIEKQTRIQ